MTKLGVVASSAKDAASAMGPFGQCGALDKILSVNFSETVWHAGRKRKRIALDIQSNVIRLCERCNPPHLGDPPCMRNIGLHDIHGAGFKVWSKVLPSIQTFS